MSYALTQFVDCPNIQTEIDRVFTGTDYANQMEEIPFLGFLQSAPNVNAAPQSLVSEVNPAPNKIRRVEVTYRRRLGEDEYTTGRAAPCSEGTRIGETSTEYTIDPSTDAISSATKSIGQSDLTYRCEADSDYLLKMFMDMADGLVRKVATKTWTQSALLYGAFVDKTDVTDNVKTVKTKDSSGNNLQDLIEVVNWNKLDMMYPNIALFGYNEATRYMTRLAAGCCGQFGLDVGEYFRQNPIAYFNDYRVADALGANHLLSVVPGSLQLLKFSKVGMGNARPLFGQDKLHFMFQDPWYGLPIEVLVTSTCDDDNGEFTYNIVMTCTTKLVGMPDDLYRVDDRFYGVNGVNAWVINNS